VLPGYQKLEFAFTSLSLRAPENVHFRYRLHGYDKNWIEAGARRNATYPRLPAGNYRFEVIASDSSGMWSATPAGAALMVAPFVWQRWWFSAGIVMAFTAAVIAAVRAISFRRLHRKLRALEQQAALDKERGRIARDIHDDLGSRLTQISLLSGLALQEETVPPQVARRVQDISASARQGIQSLDETVWAVNPRNDTLTHLVDYLNQSAVALLQAAGIPHEIIFPDHPAERTLPAEVRHHLFLAAKEALNNAVRHAQASSIAFRLTIDDESGLELVVEDNGRGFSRAPDDALADGLRNMRQRMEEIGGTFSIESQPGAGTKISLRYLWSPRK
jgi:signal transduction histidine kinase